jgi:hypothetical protein
VTISVSGVKLGFYMIRVSNLFTAQLWLGSSFERYFSRDVAICGHLDRFTSSGFRLILSQEAGVPGRWPLILKRLAL